MSKHHGMADLAGINAMCSRNPNHEGRFGRMFPHLAPLYNRPAILKALGAKGGPMDGGRNRAKGQTIPLGFVFFGQFVDHDITLDVTSSLNRVNDPGQTANFRTPALDLDCIYGSGPEAHNYLYDSDGVHLLVGENDLARSSAGTAIIGDPRNDENRLISQLQLAMINFHNAVVDHLAAESGGTLEGKDLYEEARRYVTWHYQWIIVNEYLPLIAGQRAVDRILCSGRKFYNPHRSFIPIEFSAAAYRYGHSLASQTLRVRKGQADFPMFGPTLGRGFSPVTSPDQVVEWDQFFDIDPDHPAQRADLLDGKLPEILLELPFVNPPDEQSLATRNLLRGQSFLLPGGDHIAKEMGVSAADIRKVTDHIEEICNFDLSAGIPLWFYILVEAEVIGRADERNNRPGEGLGPVGATIVAETLIGLIEQDHASYLGAGGNRNWSPNLVAGDDFTMADLLTFGVGVPA